MDFVWDNLGELVPEETFTHLHLSWSSVVPYLHPPSTTMHGILPVQSTHLTIFFHNIQVFFGLPLGLAPSTSYSIHFFTKSLSSFCNACPYHRNLFRPADAIKSRLVLVLAHPSNPGQSLEGHKMDVCVCMCVQTETVRSSWRITSLFTAFM